MFTDCDTLCPLEKFAQIMNSSIPIDIRKACGIEELVPASQAAVQKGKFQGLHRLEKYLNIQGFLEKSLKIKFALKSTGKAL